MSKAKAKPPTPTSKKSTSRITYWPLNQKQTIWLSAAIICLTGFVVFWRYISGQYLYIFEDIGSDTITVFYPNLVHLAHYYQQEGFPGWSFYLGPGQGLYPGGLLNPWDWVYFVMDAKTIAKSIAYVQLLKLIGSGVVFALFLRKMEVEKPVVLIGAILYAFGGYLVVGSGWYIHTTHIFWITVAFLGFELLLRDQKWWLFPIPFIFLVGTRAYFLILFMTLYALIRSLDYYESDWRKVIRIFGRMALCGVFAIALTAPFIGGKLTKLTNSPRVTGNVSKVETLSDKPVFELANGKQTATAILRWFSTDVLGTADEYKGFRNYLEGPLFYIGLLSLLLLPQFFMTASKRQRWLYGGLLFFWFWLILFPWFRYAFYAFAGNYYKGALSLFIPFTVLLMALMALDKIVKGAAVNVILLSATVLVALIALWYPYPDVKVGIQSNIQVMVTCFILLEAVVLAGLNFNQASKVMLSSLIGLVVIEAGLFSYTSNNQRLAIPAADLNKPLRHFDETNQALGYIEGLNNELFYRTDKVYGSVKTGYNDALVQSFYGTKMYQSHNSKHYVAFLEEMGVIPKSNEASSRWLVGVSKRNMLHPLMSIKYLLSNAETDTDVNKEIYTLIQKTGPVEIYQNKYFIPFGIPFENYYTESDFLKLDNGQKLEAIYYGAVVPDDLEHQIHDIPKAKTTDIEYNTKIVPTLIDLKANAMQMKSFSNNHIQGKINLPKPALLFFSLAYDKAWHIYVDGIEKEMLLVDIGFSGIELTPGDHEIDLKYIPPMSRLGWWFFIPGLGVYMYLVVKRIRFFPIA